MKFISLLLLLLLSQTAAVLADDDGILSGSEYIPDLGDVINNRTLHKELEKPENYPAFLYKDGQGETRVGTFLVDQALPKGPVQCPQFKIVEKQGEEPLTWEAHSTAASNVYYHLHRAIDYYNRLSALVQEPIYLEKKPVTIRLDMDVDWAMWIKFTKLQRFNTSQTFPDVDPDKWGGDDEDREIWFFVPKRKYMPKFIVARYIPGLRDTTLGTQGFPLDSARVPTIIYHEWTHLMTRPFLGITHDTPLNEGYSDYYGSVIGGLPEMGNTPEFATGPYIRDYSHDPKSITAKDIAEPGNFVPQFFWSLRRRYGDDRADMLLWRALKLLNPKSGLLDLPAAIWKAALHPDFSPGERLDLQARMQKLFVPKNGRKGS